MTQEKSSTHDVGCATRHDCSRNSALRQTDPSAPLSAKTRKQRLAEALRANLLRRKGKIPTDASQDSKMPDDQPTSEGIERDSGH
jgi:hypothetical protein